MEDHEATKKIGIIGLGTIGGELFQRMNEYGIEVFGVDPSIDSRKRIEKRGFENVFENIDELPENLNAMIECVPEKYSIKKKVFQEFSRRYNKPNTLIMTTSSTFPSRVFAERINYPERLLNAHVLPDFLVRKFCEFQTSGYTSQENMERSVKIFRDIDLETIIIQGECKGYIFNRMWHNIIGLSLELLEKYEPLKIDANVAWSVNTPYGSIFGMDYVGLDTLSAVARRAGIKLPKIVEEKIKSGQLGVKTGKGFYDHTNRKTPDYSGVEKIEEIIKLTRAQLKKDCESFLNEGQCREDILGAVMNGFPATFNPLEWYEK